MDNFMVPKAINRHVMQALSTLQGNSSNTMFVLVDKIIQHVQLQMRHSRKLPHMELFVKKSLNSLTHLGILVRSGTSEYALRQNLEIAKGVSALPWKKTDAAKKTMKPKRAVKKPKSMAKKPLITKNRIIKTKIRDNDTKSKVPLPKIKYDNHCQLKRNAEMCVESHTGFSAFLNTFKDTKISRSIKNIIKTQTQMEVESIELKSTLENISLKHNGMPDIELTSIEDHYNGSVPLNSHFAIIH